MRVPLSWIRDFTPVEADAADDRGRARPPRARGRGARRARPRDHRRRRRAGSSRSRRTRTPTSSAWSTSTSATAPPRSCAVRRTSSPGMVVPYAPSGATLPGGFTLERRKIRGVVSDGMLVLARASSGSATTTAASSRCRPTRSSAPTSATCSACTTSCSTSRSRRTGPTRCRVVGVARELAAHFGLPFTVPEPASVERHGRRPATVSVVVEAPDRCPRFTAAPRRGVTMGESPEWMQRRLTLAGMRPISNVVDVTNYVMLERGQPLHAFDLDRLRGRGLVVRLADEGEQMTTLDDVERTLTAEDLLICDAERRPAGDRRDHGRRRGRGRRRHDRDPPRGPRTSQPMGISRTSKRLGLRSRVERPLRARRRPERRAASGRPRAVELFAEVAARRRRPPARSTSTRAPIEPARITVRTARVDAVLGVELGRDGGARRARARSGSTIEGDGDDFVAVAPTFRPDLEREIDIVEEVARRVGLDEIPRTLPANAGAGGGLTPGQRERRAARRRARRGRVRRGATRPADRRRRPRRAGLPTDGTVEVENALRAEEPILRRRSCRVCSRPPRSTPRQGLPDLALFELGHVFAPPAGDQLLPDERDHSRSCDRGTVRRAPVEPDRPVDGRTTSWSVLDAIAEELGWPTAGLAARRMRPASIPRASAAIVVGRPTRRCGRGDRRSAVTAARPAGARRRVRARRRRLACGRAS